MLCQLSYVPGPDPASGIPRHQILAAGHRPSSGAGYRVVACFQTSLLSWPFLRFMAYCTPMAAAASMSNFFTGLSSLHTDRTRAGGHAERLAEWA